MCTHIRNFLMYMCMHIWKCFRICMRIYKGIVCICVCIKYLSYKCVHTRKVFLYMRVHIQNHLPYMHVHIQKDLPYICMHISYMRCEACIYGRDSLICANVCVHIYERSISICTIQSTCIIMHVCIYIISFCICARTYGISFAYTEMFSYMCMHIQKRFSYMCTNILKLFCLCTHIYKTTSIYVCAYIESDFLYVFIYIQNDLSYMCATPYTEGSSVYVWCACMEDPFGYGHAYIEVRPYIWKDLLYMLAHTIHTT